MITANEARMLTNAKFANIHKTEGFKTLMVRIEHDIRKAIDDGDTSYELSIGLLHTMSGYKLPEGVNGNAVDLAVFGGRMSSLNLSSTVSRSRTRLLMATIASAGKWLEQDEL